MRVKELALEWVYIIKEMELANKNCHVSIFLNIICSLVTHGKTKDIAFKSSYLHQLLKHWYFNCYPYFIRLGEFIWPLSWLDEWQKLSCIFPNAVHIRKGGSKNLLSWVFKEVKALYDFLETANFIALLAEEQKRIAQQNTTKNHEKIRSRVTF